MKSKKNTLFNKIINALGCSSLAILLGLTAFSFVNETQDTILNAADVTYFDNTYDFNSVKGDTTNSKHISFKEFYDDYQAAINNGTVDSFVTTYNVSSDDHQIILINDSEDLLSFSNICNDDYRRYALNFHYALGNDIKYDLTASTTQYFKIIGNSAYPFKGEFDGQGFELDQLFFKEILDDADFLTYIALKPGETSADEVNLQYFSMFSYNSGYIHNLGLKNSYMVQRGTYDSENFSYASSLVGLNTGIVDYCYYIDQLDVKTDEMNTTPGILASGGFTISGLVFANTGTVSNCYVKADEIVDDRVTEVNGVAPVIFQNTGTVSNVYYDASIYYQNALYIMPNVDGVVAVGDRDSSNPLDSYSYFVDDPKWYVSSNYGSFGVSIDYPLLKGINVNDANELMIHNPQSLILMSEYLTLYPSIFRRATFVLANDIDMSSVSKDAYSPSSTNFAGTFKSSMDASHTSSPYVDLKFSTASGKVLPYAIVNLTINNCEDTSLSRRAYGLFTTLTNTATIRDLYIVNATLDIEYTNVTYASIIADTSNGATFNNVQTNATVTVNTDSTTNGSLFYGSMFAYGTGSITNCSSSGDFNGTTMRLPNTTPVQVISVGGLIGYSDDITITTSFNSMNIIGVSSSSATTSTVYTGGVIGYGILNNLNSVGNFGTLSNSDLGDRYLAATYVGGIIGYQSGYVYTTNTTSEVKKVTNSGNININAKYYNSSTSINYVTQAAGYGTVRYSNSSYSNGSYKGIGNEGVITVTNYDIDTDTELQNLTRNSRIYGQYGYFTTGGMIVDSSNVTIDGLYNKANQEVDISIIPTYAPNVLINNDSNIYTINITRSDNSGNISYVTNSNVWAYFPKLSGNSVGQNANYNEIRNTGNLILNITNSLSGTLRDCYNSSVYAERFFRQIKMFGLLEEVSMSHYAHNLYNGGSMVAQSVTRGLTLNSFLYMSGICYKNSNTEVYESSEYYTSNLMIDANLNGSIHNAINNGNIYSFFPNSLSGNIRLSGIASVNDSLISSSFNLGNIYAYNNTPAIGSSGFAGAAGQFEVEAGGMVFQMHSQYASLKDCANYGDVIAYSESERGYALASGIVGRNDKLENGYDLVNANDSHSSYAGEATVVKQQSFLARIEYCINYGNIYSWSGHDEGSEGNTFYEGSVTGITTSSNWSNGEYSSKSAGIVCNGVMSVIDCINYGNIYSRYNGGGIYAFTRMSVFTFGSNKVYVANSINYGMIRKISTATSISSNTSYTSLSDSLFTILASTDSQQWQFGAIIGNYWSSTISTTITVFNVSCVYNFDNQIDIIGLNDYVSTNATLTQQVAVFTASMGTTKTTDQSSYPFNGIQYYSYQNMFSTSFPLNNTETANNTASVTNAYIFDYIQFIPGALVGESLAQKLSVSIGLDETSYTTGIYALSSSATILDGQFMPDNADLESMSPLNDDGTRDNTWYGSMSDSNSVYFKLRYDMKQVNASIASTVYDLELIDGEGNVLSEPIIDQANKTITYYVAANADEGEVSYNYNNLSTMTLNGYISEDGTYVEYKVGPNDAAMYVLGFNEDTGSFDDVLYDASYDLVDYVDSFEVNSATTTVTLPIPAFVQNNSGTYARLTPSNYVREGNYDYLVTNRGMVDINDGYYYIDVGTSTSRTYYLGTTRVTFSTNRYPRSYTSSGGIYTYNANGGTHGVYSTSTSGATNYYSYTDASANTHYVYIAPANASTKYALSSVDITYTYPTTVTMNYYSPSSEHNYYVNLETSSYSLAPYASLFENHTTNTTGMSDKLAQIRIPYFYEEYTQSTLSCYSQAYSSSSSVSNKSFTSSQYTVYIYLIPEKSYNNISDIIVDGNSSTATSYGNTWTINNQMSYIISDTSGYLQFTMETTNIADGQDLSRFVTITNSLGEDCTSLFILDPNFANNAIVSSTQQGLEWIDGQVTFMYRASNHTPGDTYTINIKLNDAYSTRVTFTKQMSNDAAITSLTFNGEMFTTSDFTANGSTTYLYSSIPYGAFYNSSLDYSNDYMNFTNLYDPSRLNYNDDFLIPSYLTSLDFTNLTRLTNVSMSADTSSDYKTYTITYSLLSEQGNTFIFQHILTENSPSTNVTESYLGLNAYTGTHETDGYLVSIKREENPAIRIYYDYSSLFIPEDDTISYFNYRIRNSENEEIGSSASPNSLFRVNFYENSYVVISIDPLADIGDYYVDIYYTHDSGELTPTYTWNQQFETVNVRKLANDNSLLRNIAFTTDISFTGQNTIMETSLFNETRFQQLYDDESLRQILCVPSGIYYKGNETGPFYVVGEVSSTDLTDYQPTFTLPVGATVAKVIENEDGSISLDYDDLTDDFNPTGATGEFKFIRYRVFAEDYTTENNNYSDYYCAVIDRTYTVRFNVIIEFDDTVGNGLDSSNIVTTFARYAHQDIPEEGLLQGQLSNYSSMISFVENGTISTGYFNAEEQGILDCKFATNKSGHYRINIDMKAGFTYTFRITNAATTAEQQKIYTADEQFSAIATLIPKNFNITITITRDSTYVGEGQWSEVGTGTIA